MISEPMPSGRPEVRNPRTGKRSGEGKEEDALRRPGVPTVRLSAFILFCLGIQIIWTGASDLIAGVLKLAPVAK